MVFWENLFPDFRDHVVPVDIPKIENWPALKSWMEIFVTNKHGQFVIDNIDSDHGLAFLEALLNRNMNVQECDATNAE